jgi:hypothetical protein
MIAVGGSQRYGRGMETHTEVVQRWRDLRTMLIQQLDMFETGALILRSNGVDISADAVRDLKRSILEFDALIAKDETDNP